MRLSATILAAFLAASPASAGCITDEAKAGLAAKIYAVSQVCAGWRAAAEDRATDLFWAFGGMRELDESDSCRMLVTVRAADEHGKLLALPAPVQRQVCDQITGIVRAKPELAGAVSTLGLLDE